VKMTRRDKWMLALSIFVGVVSLLRDHWGS
jgi:hypothetical protein